MTSKRIAVVGVGSMGVNHARVVSRLPGAELSAVVDPDLERATWVAQQFGGRPLGSVEELDGAVDAACVAVPSSMHLSVASRLFELGVDCLVEKPLAASTADAQLLVDRARRHGRTLVVGHIERFNPAVSALGRILADGAPVRAVDARRMSAVSARITDVDVVSDLMIHDLDIVLGMVPSAVSDVVARGVRDANGALAYVTALITFEDTTLATVTASRITQNQVRRLQVTTDERLYSVDYAAQELEVYRQGRIGEFAEGTPDGQYVIDVATERVFVRRVEPLSAELEHFIDCLNGKESPRVPGEAGVRALEVAEMVVGQCEGSR